MKSKPTTFDNDALETRVKRLENRTAVIQRWGKLSATFFAAFFLLFSIFVLAGCGSSTVARHDSESSSAKNPDDLEPAVSPEQEPVKPEDESSNRLARGEMPEEWIEPQRERIFSVDTSSNKLDLTFDDLKFDIEVGEPFERKLLSEGVKALDGKEITLSGYMRPSFKATGLKGFIFVRDDKECCFGPQAAIYDCVRVKLKQGSSTDYLVRPFKVRGQFYLKEREGPDGAIWSIFNMKNVTIES